MTKQEAVDALSKKIAQHPFRTHEFINVGLEEDKEKWMKMLIDKKKFSDLGATPDDAVVAMQRIAFVSEDFHWKQGKTLDKMSKESIMEAAAYYCKIEADRKDVGSDRFHQSIFRFPTVALNVFFMFYMDMECGENEPEKYPIEAKARHELLRVAYQTFSLPARNDETDLNPVSIQRFRKHVWWIGGNALTYRPVFYAALAFKRVDMVQVLIDVAAKSISAVSQATIETAFWEEGMCVDGFGWGHGKQAYNSGYPTDGVLEALHILSYSVGTPFESALEYADFSILVRYIQGITWGAYGDFTAPMQTRHIFLKDKSSRKTMDAIAVNLATYLIEYFASYLTEKECKEMTQLLEKKSTLDMCSEAGDYLGLRYFWNNDSMICKEQGKYIYVNMASKRCNGVEFADFMADKRNYYTADGAYVILQSGQEYKEVMGTWQVAHLPGVTERFIPNKNLLTETNWHGYHSKHNFAAGVVLEDMGICAFIYEKDETREKDGAGVVRNEFTKEMCGIKAYKSYFFIGNMFYCLGAGISDNKPEYGGEVDTTINNTLACQESKLMEKDGYVYVENDGIQYGIRKPENGEIYLKKEERLSHWYDLHAMNSNVEEKQCSVFELGIHHGKNPQDESYEYFMCFNNKKNAEIHVLENTKQLQGIATVNEDIIAAVYYDANQKLRTKTMDIQVSEPCALLLQKTEKGYRLALCDAEQKLETINVDVTLCIHGDKKRTYTIKMPQNMWRGKQGEIFISLEESQ